MKSANDRRSFMRSALATSATAATLAAIDAKQIFAQNEDARNLTRGDVAILRLLAAAEIIEADLWPQYAELGGSTDDPPNKYQLALQFLDGDGQQYITSNTLHEISHATSLNAYLEWNGGQPVNLDKFRNLRGSKATGAKDVGRLTNLMHLNVDTSWYIRDRSNTNPDFGETTD